ncbi:MAG: type II toxin-antitoxin system RelE/ParE family toxin [Candidatus Angelobacter sp.]
MSGYLLHPQAFSDLDEIWEFIAQDSLDSADRVIEEIHAAIQSLVKIPGQGHSRTDLTSRPLRFWLVHSYLIAYVPDHPLVVIGVLHGRRNPKIMAAILRDRE